jgi:hypothetical protein
LNDQHRQELLRSSAAYATARLAFANAIVAAQRAGLDTEENRACDGPQPVDD